MSMGSRAVARSPVIDLFWREAMLFAVLALLSLGLVMALSIDGIEQGVYGALHDKAVRLLPALVAFFVACRLPLDKLRWAVLPAFGIAVALCLATHVLGPRINGASRWIWVGSFTFQPVELLKPLVVFASVEVLERRRAFLGDFMRGVLPATAVPVIAAVALLGQPDVGHAFFIIAVAGVVFLVGGVRLRHGVALMLAAVALLGIVLFLLMPHALTRVLDYLHDEPGYQMARSLSAFADGGIFGQGPGAGSFASVLPESRNDFVLAILANELGLIGSLLVIGSYALMFVAGMRIAGGATSRWRRLLGLGLVVSLILQACLNIFGVTHTIPEKGIDLPFLSSGGTNLVFALASVGILANIASGEGVPGREQPDPDRP